MSVSTGSYALTGASVGFFPASLPADLDKGSMAIINSNVVVNLVKDYPAGAVEPHLTVRHVGLKVLALNGANYEAGTRVYVLTASPDGPVQVDPTSATFCGWVLRGKDLSSASAPEYIEIEFDGRPVV